MSDEFLPGERKLWEGRPAGGLILRPVEVFLIPFSLLWGGFAIFWNAMVWTGASGGLLPFKLFGLPFFVAGLYLIAGRFWLDARLRSRLRYFVTDRRVMILKDGKSGSRSIDIKRLPALEFDERADGSGTIRFGSSDWFNGRNFGIWQPSFDQTPQFIRIPNARQVYQLIQKQSQS